MGCGSSTAAGAAYTPDGQMEFNGMSKAEAQKRRMELEGFQALQNIN